MNRLLVLQSDFGLSDGAVAAMQGVALSVDPDLKIYDPDGEHASVNGSDFAAKYIWETIYEDHVKK